MLSRLTDWLPGKGDNCPDTDEAVSAVTDMLSGNAFGSAGSRVVIEEFLRGEEASFLAFTDGENIIPLASAQDHKAVYDGDTGPNTGGMGLIRRLPWLRRRSMKRPWKK